MVFDWRVDREDILFDGDVVVANRDVTLEAFLTMVL